MKSTVYVETTILSYLAADRSADLIIAGHQQITNDWWRTAKNRFDIYISEYVLAEIKVGDPTISQQRFELVKNIPLLAISQDVNELVSQYEAKLGLTGKAVADIPHFAFAVAYEMDYLITWNCSHIANGQVIRKLTLLNSELNRMTPVILTPEELLEENSDEE